MKRTITKGALLAIVWLNMAVMPCAMAFETADHDCPHCPPAEDHSMAGHHGHTESASPCATMQSDCCEIAAAAVETRTDKSRFGQTPDVGPLSRCVIETAHAQYPRYAPSADPPDPPGAFPRIHVLNCVYLD